MIVVASSMMEAETKAAETDLAVEVLTKQVFEILLVPAVRHRLAQLEHDVLELLEAELARFNVPAQAEGTHQAPV